MQNIGYFKGKKISIVGLAKSGFACASLLGDLGAQVSVTDIADNDLTRLNASKLKAKKIRVELGRHTEEFIKNSDLVVISPGVNDQAWPIVWAKNYKIPIVSEIEVACSLCVGTIIAVTGSNGKTTTTTLIGKILEASKKKVFICGNIGNPFCSELDKIKASDFVSLEVSSFQLEHISSFKPKIAVILNFSSNHLDRYNDMQEYLLAKKRIFMNQDKSDYLVLNSEDKVLNKLADETKAKTVFFSSKRGLNSNQAACLAVASILGIDEKTCSKVFSEFNGIEHRLEYVTQINNIKFINDSKATTVDSAIWALNNIVCPIIWIAGGRHKGIDYSIILELARKKVKEVILIGEAKKNIKDIFSGQLPLDQANTLEEAVNKAYQAAAPGDCVLLSPMCSSFDMFSNFEERGRCFKKAVQKLVKNKG